MIGGGAVSWLSRRQVTVALSTAEAEYMASAAQEAVWVSRLFRSLGKARQLGFEGSINAHVLNGHQKRNPGQGHRGRPLLLLIGPKRSLSCIPP